MVPEKCLEALVFQNLNKYNVNNLKNISQKGIPKQCLEKSSQYCLFAFIHLHI